MSLQRPSQQGVNSFQESRDDNFNLLILFLPVVYLHYRRSVVKA